MRQKPTREKRNMMKLVVQVIDAYDLLPKDSAGSSSPFVELDFDNHLIRTKTIPQNLNPTWNQTLSFNFDPTRNYHHHNIQVSIYNERRPPQNRNFLGKVTIPCSNLVRQGDEVYQRFQLERKSLFSPVRGEIGLVIYLSPETTENTTKTHHIQKQQMAQQPRITLRKRAEAPDSTTHHRVDSQAAPHGHESQDRDFEVKEANPQQWPVSGTHDGRGSIDLVEQMYYLYVRVNKARDLAAGEPYVEVRLGNYRGRTRHLEKRTNPEWNQVFAFSKERVQSSVLEVLVRDRAMIGRDDHLGRVAFDLSEVPTRAPPDSPLAPQWYRLEDRKGEIMVAVWMGTQADEAFADAWHADAASVHGEGVVNVRSKVYVSPKLWYLRVNVIEAQDLIINDRSREVFAKVQVGTQVLRTKTSIVRTANPAWNEDLVFVAAEPFEERLVLTVEDRVDVLGRIELPLTSFERRLDHRAVSSRWFGLEKFDRKYSSRIHLRVCLEGGYHVLDESSMYMSDQRPTAKQLWKAPVGVLEVGVVGAEGLLPMKMKDGRGCTDAYCVAKYGQKWIRTRTVIDSFGPKWNEQYTWEVFDPCTVITIGVFDNCHLEGGARRRDSRIGKVRIRLSSLEAHRVYVNSHPLLVLDPSGLKKAGELQLSVRFTTVSLSQTMSVYARPLLPKMHYLCPLTVNEMERLRYEAMGMVAGRLGRAEPPLRKEVVEYMLDVDSHMWSMRRSKANFFRLMSLASGLMSVNRWFSDVCDWKNPTTTVLVHVLFLILVWYPELLFPTVFLYGFFLGLWNYRLRPKGPARVDTRLSWAEGVSPDELDEEFDTFPTSRAEEVVRMRYDRIRSVAGRIQTVAGDVATQGERVGSLLSWRDPRATGVFVVFCLLAAVVLYATPVRVVVVGTGMYVLRHPRFRSKMPSAPANFFKRLTARTDSML